MNHLIEKPWEFNEEGKATRHIESKHRTRLEAGAVHLLFRLCSAAFAVFSAMKVRGMEMLLLVLPYSLILPFL